MLRRIVERTVRLNSGWKSRAHAPCPHHQRQRGFMSEAGAATFSIVAKRTMLIVPTAGLGAYALTSEDVKRFGFSVGVLPVRLGRDVYCATRMFVDYSWNLYGLTEQDEEYEKRKEECHARGADRLLKLCFSNGGIYIKLGQHIAMLDHLLPEIYVRTMREHMLDKCPVSSWEHVKATIEEDLGERVDELYMDFEHAPVASASLAQVHLAKDRETGRAVAVKVQHRYLRETSAVDLKVIHTLVRVVKFLAPSADFMWLVNEANDNLPRELDFRMEAENARECSRMMKSSRRLRGRVTVPDINNDKTSARVLTMEFIESGVEIADIKGLEKLGCSPKRLAHLISLAFNEMIFRYGNVHADPHPANMLVRPAPPGSPMSWQLVLLDHGLYRKLDDEFRLEYSKLWKSLIFGDVSGIEKSATAMNAGHAVPLFAGMLTQRQWKDVTKWKAGTKRLNRKRTSEEKKEIQEYIGQHAQEIGSLLGRIPRQLLLLLKTNDCLRAVDKELGAGYNSFIVTAQECTKAINQNRMHEHPGWKTAIKNGLDFIFLEYRLFVMQVLSGLGGWIHNVAG